MSLMIIHHLTSVNFFAVLVATIVYFFLGSFWFSTLFGRTWASELEKLKIIINKPSSNDLMCKMGYSFLGNLVASFGMAMLVHITNTTRFFAAIELGLLVGIGFIATSMGVSYVWASRPLKLSLIDIGYPVVGTVLSALILALWR